MSVAAPPSPPKSAAPDWSPGWGLTSKLMLVVMVACSLIFVALGVFSVVLYQQARTAGVATLAQRTQGLATSLQQVDAAGRKAAEQSFGILRDRLPAEMFKLAEVDGKPQLQHASYPVAGSFDAVDAFAALTGGVATLFQREGDDFLRVSTSLKKQDGTRAVNTLLDRTNPAYPSMVQGKTYLGRAVLFGKSYMTRYEPIVDGGKVIGIVFIGLDMGQQMDMVKQSFQLASTPTALMLAVDVNDGGTLGQLEATDKAGKLDAADPLLQAVRGAIKGGDKAGVFNQFGLDGAMPGSGPTHIAWTQFAPWGWAVVQAERASDTVAPTRHLLLQLWAMVAGGALLAAVGVLVAIRRMVLSPLRSVQADVDLLRNNNYSQPLVPRSRDELGHVIAQLEKMRCQLSANMRQMGQSASDIDVLASEVAQGNIELGARTQAASGNLQQTSHSMTQLTATVRQSADAARQANQLASSAAEVAAKGGKVVHQVVTTMDDINHSSKKIADIVGVIDSIAFQTNILALNAAVEAARAGEAGRGFAVVASEVRQLAQRSAGAAKEIKELISASVDKVQSGSKLVQDAGNTMGEIVASVQRVTDVIGEITAASHEQSEGIAQVNSAVGQLDHMTQQNAALVEHVAATADSLTHQTMRWQQTLANYTTGNDGVPETAIVKRPPPAARQGKLVAPASVPAPRATSLPPPRRHAGADAPRLGSGVDKKIAIKPMNTSDRGMKDIKNMPPARSAHAGASAARTAAPGGTASTQPTAKPKASVSADGDWETF